MKTRTRIDWPGTFRGLLPTAVTEFADARARRSSDQARRELNRMMSARGARYDAASTNRHNQKHFQYADARDADSVIGPSLQILRNRTRYEIRNNAYAKGIVNTFADDFIGCGPRFQIKSGNDKFDRSAEREFSRWCGDGDSLDPPVCDMAGKTCFSEILRLVASMQQNECGEGFIVMQTDRRPVKARRTLDRPDRGVRLRLTVIEPDRVANPWGRSNGDMPNGNQLTDGIEVDEFGKPVKYYILKKHPGSTAAAGLNSPGNYDEVDAKFVIHLVRADRPGQTRGVPWITPSLPLFAQLRAYTQATLDAAKTAAGFSGVIQSDATDPDDRVDIEEFEVIDTERDMMVTMPYGWNMKQFKPEQPTTTYAAFKKEIINEMARPLCMPLNVAAANSSEYNYASGRLDKQTYYKSIKVLRRWVDRHVSNCVARAYLVEAMLVPGLLEEAHSVSIPKMTACWFWPGAEHVDPVKEAVAQKHRLANGTTTESDEWGIQGQDWELKAEQRAKEKTKQMELELDLIAAKKKLMEKLDLTVADLAALGTDTGKKSQNGDNKNGKQTETKKDSKGQAA